MAVLMMVRVVLLLSSSAADSKSATDSRVKVSKSLRKLWFAGSNWLWMMRSAWSPRQRPAALTMSPANEKAWCDCCAMASSADSLVGSKTADCSSLVPNCVCSTANDPSAVRMALASCSVSTA